MTQPEPSPTQPGAEIRSRQFLLVAGCFLVSGFAALLYETVWLRQFAILLGTSEQALAVVLASYMGGLAIGSLVASRMVNSIRRPLLTYGLLEFGIAFSALLVPAGLSIARSLQATFLGGAAQPPASGSAVQIAFCFLTAFGLILLPTGMMGATLPMLARHVVRRNQDLGPQIGLLYSINTAGAVLGTIGAAFFLLPALGLGRTTWVGAAANLLVFALVLLLVRRGGESQPSSQPTENRSDALANVGKATTGKSRSNKKRRGKKPKEDVAAASMASQNTLRYRWILLFVAISGAVSFCYEIVFTRMLGHMFGGSVYAFATMLAGFLLGIALGGAIASRLATRRDRAVVGFVYAQALAAVTTLIAFHLIGGLMGWSGNDINQAPTTAVQVMASIAVLLPTATCVGATFPFAIRIYAKDETEAASGSARVYGCSVLGGIVGAIATGALVLPSFQYHGATTFAILCNVLIGVGAVLVIGIKPVHAIAPLAAAAGLGFGFPTMPEQVIRISALTAAATDGEVIFNHVGKSATVTVFYDHGSLRFQTNGLPESTIAPIGSGQTHRSSATWLTALPSLVRPGIQSMLVIGLGGGVAVEMVPPSVQQIDVLELEPAVVEANRAAAIFRDRDPLADPRVNIILNDGRNALSATDKKYDAIVSQPSHPWTAGASHLYTREFNQLVRDHLRPGGVFLQWMDTDFVDIELSKSMGATLLDVFPHVRLYQPFAGTFLFLASDQQMQPEAVAKSETGSTLCNVAAEDRDYYRRLGVVTATHLFALLSLDQAAVESMCDGAAVITDERNLLAMRAPTLLRGHDGKKVQAFVEKLHPAVRDGGAIERLCPSFDLGSFAVRKLDRSSVELVRSTLLPKFDRSHERATSAEDQAGRRAVFEARLLRASGDAQGWLQKLTDSARKHPADKNLAFLVLSNHALGRSVGRTSGQDLQEIGLRESEIQTMESVLTPLHLKIVQLLREIVAGNLEAARPADDQLATVDVDDVGFEMAVRLRLPWRLETTGPGRVQRGEEVVGIIDQSSAFSGGHGMAWFRASGAINANQPLIALGTIVQLAESIELAWNDSKKSIDRTSVANLLRCYELLRDPTPFQSVPRQYHDAVSLVEAVLGEVAGDQAG